MRWPVASGRAHPMLALGAAAIVALNPQFIALSAGVTNDTLLIALCTLFFAHLLPDIRGGAGRRWAVLGGIAGLALLTKQSGLLTAAGGGLAALLRPSPGSGASGMPASS